MNTNLPQLKLPRPPRNLSRREILSLVGAAIVLLAIPLTVILFRRYQDSRIEAFENAEIVEGSVKITNIHAHGFTVSWATRGASAGIVQWGPVGLIGSTAYDDRGSGAVSSTHHVTLPHPPGSDEPPGIFETPEQPFDLKIVSGNKTYGGTFDNFFDVIDVSPTAAPIRVTTGPELPEGKCDGNESYSAYGVYTYTDSGGTHLTQSLIDTNGQDSWYRTCPIGTNGPDWQSCTSWSWVDARNFRGVGNESYSAYDAYAYTDSGGTHLTQSVIDINGQDSWYRICSIGANGPDWTSCSGWTFVDQRNQRGVGNEPLPDIAPGCPDPVYGEVQKSGSVAAPGAVVYTTVRNIEGNSSAPLSTVTNNDGRYTLDLGNSRTADRSGYFSYERNSTSYSEDVSAQGGVDGSAKLIGNPTNNDQPIPTLILNHPPEISPIDDHNTTEGSPYIYQVVASDADGDTLTYGLGCPPGPDCPFVVPPGMEIDSSTGKITWSNPTPKDIDFHIQVWVNDGKSGGLVTEEYTLTVIESVDTTPPETEIVSGPAEGETVTTNPVTFTYTGTDNITATANLVYSYKLDSGNWSDWSSSTEATVTVGAGAHTFYVKAKDEAGNEDQTPAQRSFTVDTQGPTIDHTPVTTAPENQDIEIKATITDPSGVASIGFCQRKSDSGGWSCVSLPFTGGLFSTHILAEVVTRAGVDYYITALDGLGNFSSHPEGAPPAFHHINITDATPPAAITGLTTSNPTNSTLTLTWTAPGDDGNTGTASQYDLRYSTATITNDNWGSATPVTGEPTPKVAGSTETFVVTNLTAETTYYFVIKTADEIPNWSALSNVASGTTLTESDLTPHIDNITPSEGPIGTRVTISGYNFGVVRGTQGVVIFTNNVFATDIDSWNDIQIVADVPTGTVTGNVVVQTGAGASNGVLFTVTEIDKEGPTIDHTPVTTAPENQDIEIKATITDPSGVASIRFCHRRPDEGGWGCVSFPFTGGLFSTHILAEVVTQVGVDYYLTAVDQLGNSSSHPEGAPPAFHHINITDATPPAAITNLTVTTTTTNSATLTWAAPGDDGSTGTANGYDLRYSTSTIADANWGNAPQAVGEPTPKVAGSAETFTVTGLSSNTTYYFAIKTADEVPNWSALSNVASGKTEKGETPTATLNINLLMQGRPGYPTDSRGSSGTVDIFARRPGETTKLWEVDDQAITAGGATGAMTLQGLSIGTAYDFFLKGYIHLTVKKSVTLGSENSVNFGTILVGDLNSSRDDQVNSLDNDIVLTGWQATWNTPQTCPSNYTDCKLADFNLDSKVNSIDHDYIFTNWGKNGDK